MRMLARAVLTLVCLATVGAAAAEAKSYSAQRFDSLIRVTPGGAIEVTETVTFRFESGTFDHVFREIPKRRTDGIEILGASMDGRPFPFGTGIDRITTRVRESRLRVQWQFASISPSTHTFELTYRVRGVVQQTAEGDLLAWRALPTEHAYTIDVAQVDVKMPEGTGAAPLTFRTDRVRGRTTSETSGETATIRTSDIRTNGWVEIAMTVPAGTLIANPPEWQQQRLRANALAPAWATTAVVVGVAALVLLFAIRQQYDTPPRDLASDTPFPDVPESVSPAVAGAIVSNGRVALEHAMAAVVGLAATGVLAVEELPRGTFGQRSFILRRRPAAAPLAPSNQAALDVVFDATDAADVTIPLTKARSRLQRRLKRVADGVTKELRSAGLFDEDRARVKQRTFNAALTLVLVATAALVACVLLVNTYGPWPLLVPGSLLAAGVIGLVVSASMTPLSNDGLRRAARWRGYRTHLRQVAADTEHGPEAARASALPFVIALGLSGAWAKYLKRHPAVMPAWFTAADDGGFPAFVAYGGHAAGGAHGGGAGAAAGGGASGAG